jgi:5-methylthioadenosine/S-adenosylhomocysteine deaminase
LVIDAGRLTAVAEGDWPGGSADIIDGAGCVALPGFVNAHTHANMGLHVGLGDVPRPPASTLYPAVPPYTSFLSEDEHRQGALLTMVAAVRSGTTTLCSCDRYAPATTVAAAEAVGIRTLSGVLANDPGLRPVGRPNWPVAADELVALAAAHKGNDLRRFFIGAHSPYSCPPEQILDARARADDHDLPFNMHVAESDAEQTFVQERYGTTPVRYLDDLGVLDARTIVNHAIHVDDDDIAILAARGVGVVTCPFGSAKNGAVAPVAEMLGRGVNVGLGTDSLLSNNSLSMLRELALVIQLQRVRARSGGVLQARDAIRMATLGSATVLGWERDIGSLERGKGADVVLYDVRHPWGLTIERVEADIAFAAGRLAVRTVIVSGRIIFSNGVVRSVDEETLWADLGRTNGSAGPREWDPAYRADG